MTSVNTKHEALLDALLKDYTDPHDILGEHGLLKQLTKRLDVCFISSSPVDHGTDDRIWGDRRHVQIVGVWG